ncbi:ADP-ribosyl cyclase/cyclic ADP-ribose hydrolase 1 [Oryzias melastigma]|uniref:ADP-ribosyl cyclase/cyclic ADP-ribose hydrolase 1 n=1 Tax=Oryzias melastigma TaxID=30732 RepID=UPI000CF83F92|nr:ADP-ribosyl cyclase/cyclic ADP-ribose hydrolase 1 [Oryzias melastigma]
MEQQELGGLERKRRRRKCLVISGVVLLLLVAVVLVLALVLTLGRSSGGIKSTFLERCQKFEDLNCQNLWDVFQQAYINRDPCNVPGDAYDPFIKALSFKPKCNRMMFWSKTKDLVHSFTQKRDCFVTVEDVPLGAILNDLTWCGKQGSNETFTTGCPGWSECDNNPVRSYWNRASAAFADAACGDVSAMLSGSIMTPFSPGSVFESIEVKRLRSPNVKRMNVVLVIEENAVTNCTNASLDNLQKALAVGISYGCKEVTKAQINKCSSDLEIACGACW